MAAPGSIIRGLKMKDNTQLAAHLISNFNKIIAEIEDGTLSPEDIQERMNNVFITALNLSKSLDKYEETFQITPNNTIKGGG